MRRPSASEFGEIEPHFGQFGLCCSANHSVKSIPSPSRRECRAVASMESESRPPRSMAAAQQASDWTIQVGLSTTERFLERTESPLCRRPLRHDSLPCMTHGLIRWSCALHVVFHNFASEYHLLRAKRGALVHHQCSERGWQLSFGRRECLPGRWCRSFRV